MLVRHALSVHDESVTNIDVPDEGIGDEQREL